MGIATKNVTFPSVCPRPEAKFVRKSPVSRSMRWCQKHRILCLWRHSVSESTNWTLSMSKSLNAEEADDGLENCLLPSFGVSGRSRRVQSNENTCLILVDFDECSVFSWPFHRRKHGDCQEAPRRFSQLLRREVRAMLFPCVKRAAITLRPLCASSPPSLRSRLGSPPVSPIQPRSRRTRGRRDSPVDTSRPTLPRSPGCLWCSR